MFEGSLPLLLLSDRIRKDIVNQLLKSILSLFQKLVRKLYRRILTSVVYREGSFVARETILILDADKNSAWTLKTLLEDEEYPTVITDTIGKAVKNFSEFQISGFITEYWIKNERTLEAIRKLKEIYPEAYVMMITDKEIDEEEYEEVMECGIDDYFLKPLATKKLLVHLRKGLKYRSLLIEKKRIAKKLTPDFGEGMPSVPKIDTVPI
jgi:DNA-binding NtrC family response regulator